jgi:hypothetical protein
MAFSNLIVSLLPLTNADTRIIFILEIYILNLNKMSKMTKAKALSVGLPPNPLEQKRDIMNEQILRSIYYDPKYGYKGIRDLLKKAIDAGA